MKTNIIKWDEGMAVRCLARCSDRTIFTGDTTPEDIIQDEIPWEDFAEAISEALGEK